MTERKPVKRFRSLDWFAAPGRSDMAALYLERFMNYGMTPEELRSGRPIIGIAQSGSDLNPCNRHHLELAKRVRDGIRDAGGIPIEFPTHPIFENCRRPTAAIDRNLAFMTLVEILYGYPIDAVVLTTGCDKTTPSAIMAASSLDMPAIVLSGGPMLDGWHEGELVGSGTVIWRSRRKLAAGQITEEQFLQAACDSAPSAGHCNTMGTASTMNAVAEALGMSLPGCSAIPAPYRERGQMAYETGRRIVDMAYEDLTPSKILTRAAFRNAIATVAAIGGSTNAQPHINAMARHAEVALDVSDWSAAYDIPLLLNMQPAGKYLGERFHHAGGVPAILCELLKAGRIDGGALTCTGKSLAKNIAGRDSHDREMIRTYDDPLMARAGFLVLKGNLFDFAIMKTSVISADFRQRYLSRPGHENVFEGKAVVFDGSDDYHHRINDPSLGIDADTILVIRGSGPVGWPRLGRSREHAAARCAAEAGDRVAADAGRRPPVRHVRQPLDPQRRARKRDRRRPRLAQDRRRHPHRPRRGHLQRAGARRRDRPPQAGRPAAGAGDRHGLAGNLPCHRRPDGHRRRDGARTEIQEDRQQDAAAQSLKVSPVKRGVRREARRRG